MGAENKNRSCQDYSDVKWVDLGELERTLDKYPKAIRNAILEGLLHTTSQEIMDILKTKVSLGEEASQEQKVKERKVKEREWVDFKTLEVVVDDATELEDIWEGIADYIEKGTVVSDKEQEDMNYEWSTMADVFLREVLIKVINCSVNELDSHEGAEISQIKKDIGFPGDFDPSASL